MRRQPPGDEPPTQPSVADTEGGHSHRCREGHTWYHAEPAAQACRISEYSSPAWGSYISPEDCALCTGRDDLLIRGVHVHRCPMCDGPWTHEGRCTEGLSASCPWCFQGRAVNSPPGARAGSHRHFCPRCLQTWGHSQPCAAPLRVQLTDCPGCHAPPSDVSEWRFNGEELALRPRACPSRRSVGWLERRARVGATAIVLGSGVLLGVGLLRLFVSSDDPRGRTPSAHPQASSAESQDTIRDAASTVPPSASQEATQDPPSRATPTASSPRAPSANRAGDPATRPEASVSLPVKAPPAQPNLPIEIVTIRFKVVDRTPLEWVWSWQLTLHNRSDAQSVSVNIEFIGPDRALVDRQMVCGIRVPAGEIAVVNGVRAVSASAAEGIWALTAWASAPSAACP